MKTGKILKVWDSELETLSANARNINALAHMLNKAIQSEQLDIEYVTDVVDIMAGFTIDIVDKIGEIEVSR
ncbi:hypothetical protein KIJ05_00535 [Leuconostoc gelidum subsp. gasicomitatum]|uniref:hypothetical protein n=1 Tax=Leuconostoc gasicomitatum TaxID=115778 RepID=UPI001CC4935D|nr:hypothetical protein [Leuconostoc gasicomitatum]MBZ5983629.1 hypothetical protein [Leuconostoc gasicomitatum]